MAVLTTAQRLGIFAKVQRSFRRWLGEGVPTALDKNEWKTLLAAADDFLDANSAAYNTSIPVAVRTKATAREKALALYLIIEERFDVGA